MNEQKWCKIVNKKCLDALRNLESLLVWDMYESQIIRRS